MGETVVAGSDKSPDTFGGCCADLNEALSGADFEPLLSVGEDGDLYLSVGLIELEDEEPGFVDHPMFFCSFCGTGLQSPDEVRAKTKDPS